MRTGWLRLGCAVFLIGGLLEDKNFLAGADQFEALPDFELLCGFVAAQPLNARAAEFNIAIQVGVRFLQGANLFLFLN